MRYREFKIVNEQDIHNPNVNMKDVFETMDMIQEMGLGLRWTDSDDGIVILGALGDPKFNKKIRSMYSEFNTTDNPSADSQPDFELSTMSNNPGRLGDYNPNTGRIRISSKQNIKSAKATIAHEAAHRGFAIIYKISELKRLAHPDLNGIWEGGWGEKDYQKFPIMNDEQVNPEHCMIYSVLGIGHREYLRIFLEGIMKISSEAREYFNSSEFNNREFYADADSEYPLQGLEKLRAYWAELYDTTSRNVRNYLNSRLSSPRPVSRDDKNQNRGTSYGRVRMPQDDTPVPQRDNNPDPTPVSTPSRRQPRGGDSVTGIDDINDILTGKKISTIMRYREFKIAEAKLDEIPDDGNRAGQQPNANTRTQGPDDGSRAGQEPNRPAGEATELVAGPPYPPEESDAVKAMQTRLEELGYSVGSTGIDGKYGPRTTRAVRSFKQDNNISSQANVMSAGDIQKLNTAEKVDNPTPTGNEATYGRQGRRGGGIIDLPAPEGGGSGQLRINSGMGPLLDLDGSQSRLTQRDAGAEMQATIQMARRMAEIFGKPVTINDAIAKAGTSRERDTQGSQHFHGTALDLDVSGFSDEERLQLVNAAMQAGFTGFGFGSNILHVDRGPRRHWAYGNSTYGGISVADLGATVTSGTAIA